MCLMHRTEDLDECRFVECMFCYVMQPLQEGNFNQLIMCKSGDENPVCLSCCNSRSAKHS